MNNDLIRGVAYSEGFTEKEISSTADNFSLICCRLMLDYVGNLQSPKTGKEMTEIEKLEMIMLDTLKEIDDKYLLIPRDGKPCVRGSFPHELPENISNFSISGNLHDRVSGYMDGFVTDMLKK